MANTPRILLVDDDKNIRETLGLVLRKEGYDVVVVSSSKEAIEENKKSQFTLLITDLKLPDIDGVQLISAVRKTNPETLAIIITAHAGLESAIRAIRLGAYDYIQKPFKMEEILLTVKRALQHAELLRQNVYLKRELKDKYHPDNIVGTTPGMLRTFDLIRKVAGTNVTVLIRGESGTGKELAARAIHHMSQRGNGKFVPLSCGALPETLLESELFGYEKGAFTGAVSRKPGLFEMADGGTLFLDEIGDLSPSTQIKVLRVLQEREFQPVGGVKQIKVDIRLISATNKDLEKAAKDGKFREDLYYRLNVVTIELPPLRERKDDIPLLVQHFLKQFSKSSQNLPRGSTGSFASSKTVSKPAMALLTNYSWPGNVRELENVLERAMVLGTGDTITPEDLPEGLVVDELARTNQSIVEPLNFKKARDEFEEQFLRKILDICGGNISEAARKSGISRRYFHQKIKKYKIY